MTLFDVIVLLLAVAVFFAGWQQGFLASISALVGFVAGMVAGRFLGPWLGSRLQESGWLAESAVPTLTVAFPLVLGVVLSGVGGFIGATIRDRITNSFGQGLDALGGGLSGVVSFGLIIWLAAGWIQTTPWITPNRWVADSGVVAGMDRAMPISSTQALGSLASALADTGFPKVFEGQREQIRGVGAPSEDMVAVGQQVDDSVVKIVTTETRCGRLQEGSGWGYADGMVATNAHVVAGSSELAVQIRGEGRPYSAEVVAIDGDKDIAILHVPELSAPALPFGQELGVGDDSVVVGFPENGPYTISPTRVRDLIKARGLDIYNADPVVREVYSLRGVIRPGNSGGPLLNSEAEVVGMVFARSASDPETGYALSLDEIDEVLAAADERTEPVVTGACAVQSPDAG